MTNTFEESQHPRGAAGKFATKATPAPSGSLGLSDAAIDAAFSDDAPAPAPGGSERIEALLDAAYRDADLAAEQANEADRRSVNRRARITALYTMCAMPDATGVSMKTADPDYTALNIHLRDGRTATWDGDVDFRGGYVTLSVNDGTERKVPFEGNLADRLKDTHYALYEMGSADDPILTGGVTEADGLYALTWDEQGNIPDQSRRATTSTIPARDRLKAASERLMEAEAEADRLRIEVVRETAAALDPRATKLSFAIVHGEDGLGVAGGFWLHRDNGESAHYFLDDATHFDGSSRTRVQRRSESAGLEQTPCDVVGQVPEPEG